LNPNKELDIKKYSNFLVFSISLIPLIIFLFIIWNRLSLPFVFEWGESAGVNQIYRILSRKDLYVRPSLDFAPLVYTPLYYFIAAGISKIIGTPLLAARIISVISTAASVYMIARLVQAESGNALLAWLAGMFYLACFALSGGFYDLARVDSFYILMMLIGISTILNSKTIFGYLLFGIILALGFFTKQSFLIVFLPLQLFLFIRKGKLAWVAAAGQVIGVIVPLYLVNTLTDNWLFYYLFKLPGQHGYSFIAAINFWIGDTIRPLGILFAFSLVFLLACTIDLNKWDPTSSDKLGGGGQISRSEKDRWWIFILFFAGAAGAAWITRSSNGGGLNNCMPIYAALAISFGIGANMVLNSVWVKEKPWAYGFVMLVISLQFIGLVYNPFNFIPTSDEINLNENISKRINDSDQQVFIPYRSHLSEEISGRSQIHMVNLFELTGYFKGEILSEGYELVDQARENICFQKYGLIVLDQPVPWFADQLNEAYYLDVDLAGMEYKGSDLLEWQQGVSQTYLPLDEYDLEICLGTIAE
jgi:4-amino-4-deoxy-L-arabinose transferase-like glycosyltransferase